MNGRYEKNRTRIIERKLGETAVAVSAMEQLKPQYFHLESIFIQQKKYL
jgi:hypothetical protein